MPGGRTAGLASGKAAGRSRSDPRRAVKTDGPSPLPGAAPVDMTAVITPAATDHASATREQLLARLLYRDALMLIIDKPAGLAVPRPQGRPQSRGSAGRAALRSAAPSGLAHRLDRDTSGRLVLGRHHRALRRLGCLFAAGRADKTYWAVVEGAPRRRTAASTCRSAGATGSAAGG